MFERVVHFTAMQVTFELLYETGKAGSLQAFILVVRFDAARLQVVVHTNTSKPILKTSSMHMKKCAIHPLDYTP